MPQRLRFPVFCAMVLELRLALEDGVRVYREAPDLSCSMLVEGISYLQRTFVWDRTAQEYARVFAEPPRRQRRAGMGTEGGAHMPSAPPCPRAFAQRAPGAC